MVALGSRLRPSLRDLTHTDMQSVRATQLTNVSARSLHQLLRAVASPELMTTSCWCSAPCCCHQQRWCVLRTACLRAPPHNFPSDPVCDTTAHAAVLLTMQHVSKGLRRQCNAVADPGATARALTPRP